MDDMYRDLFALLDEECEVCVAKNVIPLKFFVLLEEKLKRCKAVRIVTVRTDLEYEVRPKMRVDGFDDLVPAESYLEVARKVVKEACECRWGAVYEPGVIVLKHGEVIKKFGNLTLQLWNEYWKEGESCDLTFSSRESGLKSPDYCFFGALGHAMSFAKNQEEIESQGVMYLTEDVRSIAEQVSFMEDVLVVTDKKYLKFWKEANEDAKVMTIDDVEKSPEVFKEHAVAVIDNLDGAMEVSEACFKYVDRTIETRFLVLLPRHYDVLNPEFYQWMRFVTINDVEHFKEVGIDRADHVFREGILAIKNFDSEMTLKEKVDATPLSFRKLIEVSTLLDDDTTVYMQHGNVISPINFFAGEESKLDDYLTSLKKEGMEILVAGSGEEDCIPPFTVDCLVFFDIGRDFSEIYKTSEHIGATNTVFVWPTKTYEEFEPMIKNNRELYKGAAFQDALEIGYPQSMPVGALTFQDIIVEENHFESDEFGEWTSCDIPKCYEGEVPPGVFYCLKRGDKYELRFVASDGSDLLRIDKDNVFFNKLKSIVKQNKEASKSATDEFLREVHYGEAMPKFEDGVVIVSAVVFR